MRVALGFRPHSGWAAAVTVAGGAAAPEVLTRERIALADVPPPVQPYHEAAGLGPDAAAAVIDRATKAAYQAAADAVAALVGQLDAAGHRVAGAGVVAGPGSIREDMALTRILAAHATLHAAEGELYRDALADAVAGLGLAVTLLPSREAPAAGRRLFRRDDAAVRAFLTDLGRPLGPPWTRDEKDATVAALLALNPD